MAMSQAGRYTCPAGAWEVAWSEAACARASSEGVPCRERVTLRRRLVGERRRMDSPAGLAKPADTAADWAEETQGDWFKSEIFTPAKRERLALRPLPP